MDSFGLPMHFEVPDTPLTQIVVRGRPAQTPRYLLDSGVHHNGHNSTGLPTMPSGIYSIEDFPSGDDGSNSTGVQAEPSGIYAAEDLVNGDDGHNSTDAYTELSGVFSPERSFWDPYYDIRKDELISDILGGGITDLGVRRNFPNPDGETYYELTPLEYAYDRNDLNLVSAVEKMLEIDRSGELNHRDIFAAIRDGDFNLVHELIERAVTATGLSAAHIINVRNRAGYNTIGVVQAMIFGDPKRKDRKPPTEESIRKQYNILKLLLARGAVPSFEILKFFVLDNNFMFLNHLERRYPGGYKLLINESNDSGLTLLAIGAMGGNVDTVNSLIRMGADINAGGGEVYTPLMFAVQNQHLDVVRKLIERGARVDLGGGGSFPVTLAAEGDNESIMQALILAQAKRDVVDRDGYTPLWYAVRNSNSGIVRGFIPETSVLANTHFPDGDTPLMAAISNGDPEVVKAVIRAGGNINAVLADGSTPLIRAINNDNLKIVKVIIEAGASVNTVFPGGNTLLMIAVSRGNIKIVNLIITAGADLDVKNGEQTAEDLAKNRGDIVELIRQVRSDRALSAGVGAALGQVGRGALSATNNLLQGTWSLTKSVSSLVIGRDDAKRSDGEPRSESPDRDVDENDDSREPANE